LGGSCQKFVKNREDVFSGWTPPDRSVALGSNLVAITYERISLSKFPEKSFSTATLISSTIAKE
jgi:hypothetical protein